MTRRECDPQEAFGVEATSDLCVIIEMLEEYREELCWLLGRDPDPEGDDQAEVLLCELLIRPLSECEIIIDTLALFPRALPRVAADCRMATPSRAEISRKGAWLAHEIRQLYEPAA